MQTESTQRSPGGHARDNLLRQARHLRFLHDDPLKSARLDPEGRGRYADACLFREVVAYLVPILKVVFRSREIELARQSVSTTTGEIAIRFMLRSDGTLVKYDQANNSDTASPVEFLHSPERLDAALITLWSSLMGEQTPLALAAADEVHAVREALGTAQAAHA